MVIYIYLWHYYDTFLHDEGTRGQYCISRIAVRTLIKETLTTDHHKALRFMTRWKAIKYILTFRYSSVCCIQIYMSLNIFGGTKQTNKWFKVKLMWFVFSFIVGLVIFWVGLVCFVFMLILVTFLIVLTCNLVFLSFIWLFYYVMLICFSFNFSFVFSGNNFSAST